MHELESVEAAVVLGRLAGVLLARHHAPLAVLLEVEISEIVALCRLQRRELGRRPLVQRRALLALLAQQSAVEAGQCLEWLAANVHHRT